MRRLHCFAATVVGLLMLASGVTVHAEARARKLALVIGNSAYTAVTPLGNPEKDQKDVCGKLARLGFAPMCFSQVQTRAEFEALVDRYVAALEEDGVGVFFYSGHGVQVAGDNYLVPTDAGAATTSDPLKQLYPLSDLFDKLRTKRSAFQLVVLDACRSDPFAAPSDERPGAQATKRAVFSKALQVVARASYGAAPISDAPPGAMVLYATASRDTAFDGADGNGPLTKHFLLHVDTRGMPVEDLTKRVISGVQDETRRIFGKEQTPYVYGSFRRRFCFAGCFDPRDFQVPPSF